MGRVQFLLALHNHQPVGNFENVFREAYEKCYEPFLKFLEEHPRLRISLHYSGCLFDWIQAREKKFLNRLSRLVRHNQIEMLGGGYYEPVLPLISERDAVAQMNFMNQYLRRHFGRNPTGFWLTERIWEPKLPRLAAHAGLRYTALDDTHFALAGLAESEIRDLFLTEEEGHPLYVFPIPKTLRYAIPFREPQETLNFLREMSPHEGSEPAVVTYADDGEKFGLWPGTYQWVYRNGWLERFARALEENQSWIELKTFQEVLQKNVGRRVKKVYLPTASYEEMTEWAMNREKSLEFSKLKRDLESTGLANRSRVFFQGGTFKNFLSKYSEADWMRSKMNWVSRKVAGIKNPARRRRAERELWQAQCNCPYWHGVFGGLYLHHLRRSTYEHLIRSELQCTSPRDFQRPRFFEEDLNQDGAKEVVLESSFFTFYASPERGGALLELDLHPVAMNVLDVLTRREEAYHVAALQTKKEETGSGKSIHEFEKRISQDVLERTSFDRWERLSFLDHLLPEDTSITDFRGSRFAPLLGNPVQRKFTCRHEIKGRTGWIHFTGQAPVEGREPGVKIEKTLRVSAGSPDLVLELAIQNEGRKTLDALWGIEWNFNFFERERTEEAGRIEIQDGWSPVHLQIAADDPFRYWQFPIETLAQTESDYRLIHQGISIFPHWRISLAPGQTLRRVLKFTFSTPRP